MPRRKADKAAYRNIYAADFETTVYQGQDHTEVWSSAFCPVRNNLEMTGKRPYPQAVEKDVIIHTNIRASYEWLESFPHDVVLYYHNLKFDGSFWLDFLMKNGWRWFYAETRKDSKNAEPYTIETCISDLGQWYFIKLHFKDHIVEMRDSLKLMPQDLRSLGKSFKTKHQKLDMNYKRHEHADEYITAEERKYIKNDVLVLMEALEIMFAEGHDKLTIGSCCMAEYKKSIPKMAYKQYFAQLDNLIMEPGYDAATADEYIRKAYKGGWCYAMPERCRKIIRNGCTADVNSLYPSMMHSESGNYYPVGMPHFWHGRMPDAVKEGQKNNKMYYFIRIECAFSIKLGFLPFIQIKDNPYYSAREMLEDSRPRIHGKKYMEFVDSISGEKITNRVELTLTCTDYILFHEHYNVYDEIQKDGCWFYTDIGIFDDYINKYRDIKMHSTGAVRQIAKLFLNNLYGKMASSNNSSYKRPVLVGDSIVMQEVEEYKKKAVYIPVGAAITSYARNFTIRAAQKNYKYFCYADTDSIHCACSPEKLQGVPVDPVRFCCWKIETCWNIGWFIRAKTYIEHVIEEDQKLIDNPYYNVKCAGLPENCKDLFIKSMTETEEEAKHHEQMANAFILANEAVGAEYDPEEVEEHIFLSKRRKLQDFDRGLNIYGKLMPVRIPGGIVLKRSYFTIN